MNCAYHNDQAARGVCTSCGRPICDTCAVELHGQLHCKSCIGVRMQQPGRDVSGFARFVLSIFPGLGHLYMGLVQRGFQLMLGFGAGFVVLVMLAPGLLGFFIPASIFFSIFDAREAHIRQSQGLEVEDKAFVDIKTWQFQWDNRYVGYGLVGLGCLALYRVIVQEILRIFITDMWMLQRVTSAVNGLVLGVAAIAAGLWLLRRNAGKSQF